MPITVDSDHLLTFAGLAEAIRTTPVSDSHKDLLKAVRRFDPLHGVMLAAVRDEGGRLQKRRVLDAAGQLVHDNHEEWLRGELDADAGHASTTLARLRGKGYLLSVCRLKTLHLVHDRGGVNQANFIQLDIWIEDEWLDQEMFTAHSWRDAPRDLRDLVNAAEEGYPLDDAARRQLSPSRYVLHKAVDVARFVEEAEDLDRQNRHALKNRRYRLLDSSPGAVEQEVSIDELSPAWDAVVVKTRRPATGRTRKGRAT